jgi:hypothetical protein
VDRVKQWWTFYCFQASMSFILVLKLKALKADLQVWNEVFGNVERKKKLLLDDLRVLEGLEEEC